MFKEADLPRPGTGIIACYFLLRPAGRKTPVATRTKDSHFSVETVDVFQLKLVKRACSIVSQRNRVYGCGRQNIMLQLAFRLE